jgi:hypothetical protein
LICPLPCSLPASARRQRPINHVNSLYGIAQERVAMAANTAVDDLVVTL